MHAGFLTQVYFIIHSQVWEMFLTPYLRFNNNSSSTKATWEFFKKKKHATLESDWTPNGTISRHSYFRVASHFQNGYYIAYIFMYIPTVVVISQNVTPFFYCKIPTWRVGVWPIWVGPAHSKLGQPTLDTSSLRHPKMSYFHLVLLEI